MPPQPPTTPFENTAETPPPGGDVSFEEVYLAYQEAKDAGKEPDRAAFVAHYPHLRGELERAFAEEDALDARFGPLAVPRLAAGEGELPRPFGNYELLEEIGRGGMGVVYKARQVKLNRIVAVKLVLAGMATGSADLARLRSEAEAIARLQDPHIVQIFEVGEHEGLPFLALEFCPGGSLARRLDGTPLPPPEAARLIEQLARAVHAVHEQNVVHRDLTPANVLLAADGTPKVTDFGLAKRLDTTGQTVSGAILGTPSYMAPEQAHGQSRQVGPAADVYALGAILYECLTGRPPFRAPTTADTLLQVIHDEPVPPRRLQPKVPRDLETICLKALQKDPSKRYTSAQELAGRLRLFLEGRPIPDRPMGKIGRLWRWCRRNPAVAALATALATLLVVVAGGALVAAFWLGKERDDAVQARDALEAQHRATLAENERAERAERRVREGRWDTYLANVSKAQAGRRSGLPGRRFESLEALRQAARVGRELEMSRERVLQLRNEAVGCLSLADLRLLRQWDLPGGQPSFATFDHTLERYTVGDRNGGTIQVRHSDDNRELLRLPGPMLWTLQFSPDGRFLAGTTHDPGKPDGLLLWRLASRTLHLQLPFWRNHAFSPDSRWLAVGDPQGVFHLYDFQWEPPKEKTLPRGPRTQGWIAFDPGSRRLAVCTLQPPAVEVCDLDGGRVLARFNHPTRVFGVAWHPGGELLATACGDSNLYVWEAANPHRPLRVLRGHQAEVTEVAFSPQGDLLVSNSWDQTARLWDPGSGRELITLPGMFFRFSADGGRLALFLAGPKVSIWEVDRGRECRWLTAAPQVGRGPWAAEFSPDGRLLASCHDDGVRLWDRRGRQLALLPGDPGLSVHFHPKDGSLLTWSQTGPGSLFRLHRWPVLVCPAKGGAELQVGPPQRLLDTPTAGLPVGSLSPDGKRMALADGRACYLLDLATGKVVWRGEQGRCARTAFSPDGRWVVSATWQGKDAKVWEAQGGKCVAELPVTHNARLAFTPDSRWLVTGSGSDWGTGYCFWEVGPWRLGRRIPHEGLVMCELACSRDGTVLAINPARGVVRLLDPGTGREFATLPTHNPLCFSPDGSCLVTSPSAHSLQLWDLRRIRAQLANLGLDWELPPYRPAGGEEVPGVVRVRVLSNGDTGPRPPPRK
jgi:WD40 repeat protein/tRNA A-37 threonylcarbamoyl transferase component Bud32